MPRTQPTIQSSQNPKIKAAVKLRDASQRRKSGRFLIDGQAEVERAVSAGITLETLFVTDSDQSVWSAAELPPGVLQPVAENLLPKLTYGQRHSGPVAVAVTPAWTLSKLVGTKLGSLLILDRTEKPGNLGACLRSASACGLDGVVLTDPICELFNPNTIRASRGCLFTIPIATAPPSELVAFCRRHGVTLFAARVDGDQELWTCDFRGASALVFGNEAEGLGATWQRPEVRSFRIPMHRSTDSLNLSISAAVSMYELVRQRS